jgi:hypothetical protein
VAEWVPFIFYLVDNIKFGDNRTTTEAREKNMNRVRILRILEKINHMKRVVCPE